MDKIDSFNLDQSIVEDYLRESESSIMKYDKNLEYFGQKNVPSADLATNYPNNLENCSQLVDEIIQDNPLLKNLFLSNESNNCATSK